MRRGCRPAAPFPRALAALALLLALLAGCHAPRPALDVPPGSLYARFGLRLERGVYRSTNYRSPRTSALVPVNTEVKVLAARGNRVRLKVVNGPEFELEHVARHTFDTLQEAFDKAFTPEPVDLAGFSAGEQAAIERGEPLVGMTRAAVLAAMGPPPAVGTITLDSNVWKYWNTRFTTFEVRFGDDGHVTEIDPRP